MVYYRIGVILGLCWHNSVGLYWGYLGIMEKKMETAIVSYLITQSSSFHFLFHYPQITPI